jgi:putative transposase
MRVTTEGPRRRHFDEPGHAHKLTFSRYRRFRFLAAERTCLWLAQAIDQARRRHGFAVWAYVFMPEHVHLIVHPGRLLPRVELILKAIKQPVGRRAIVHRERHVPGWLPRISRKRAGRIERLFWQPGGGYDRNIVEPRTLALALDDLHRNPVRRGLVERASDWRWSSAGWFRGEAPNPLRPDPIPCGWCDA